ncbi:DUF6221 family protein [Micromonospora sp. NPDC047730]|uniref:DUF6221 family protein n=1 Tax=Micromonospora sp. NPDC047730 TaxID=3364253 RepID=UPI003716D331
MNADLVTWLRQQLDEDEYAAKRAGADHPSWSYDRETFAISSSAYSIAARKADGSPLNDVDGEHIARHDPARVLAEVDAKRRIIAEYERYAAERRRAMGGWDTRELSPILAALALPYADRPGYRVEWQPA